ncbi:glucosamine-6-phosphate deaminase [Gracilibacillus kekensis]|nr:glucosamine-6-phosphate deaminase [Gracilibacillus kekensis]
MKLIRTKNYQEMSKEAARFINKRVHANPALTLGLATGGTPIQTYENLAKDYQQNETSYQQITTFNLDEYIGLPETDPNSYHFYMQKHLFSKINIPNEQTFIPNGQSDNLAEECIAYEDLIKKHGGIDLQILGLGHNGHIGFNEPGTSFEQRTHIVKLAESTINANARFFDTMQEVPKKAITMGISTIMESKEILLLVTGKEKYNALTKLLHGEIDPSFPASILNEHNNLTVIATEDAIISNKIS